LIVRVSFHHWSSLCYRPGSGKTACTGRGSTPVWSVSGFRTDGICTSRNWQCTNVWYG